MDEYNTNRREMLKTTGVLIAGITGTTALMPGTAAAAKSNWAKVIADSGSSSYRMELSDPNPVIKNKEASDYIDKSPNSSVVYGEVDATFAPRYDKILYNGTIYDFQPNGGDGHLLLDSGSIVYSW